ncbi:carbohydrate sulfotransferase 11-like [Lineus longissimus]|uniref:carbohydrate sulfotransferase 11-like n=1 Tax=Lineus longissimus TaxID=88925 RepID=UPI00315D9F84
MQFRKRLISILLLVNFAIILTYLAKTNLHGREAVKMESFVMRLPRGIVNMTRNPATRTTATARVLTIYEQRRQKARDVCKKLFPGGVNVTSLTKRDVNHFLVDEKRKFIYCQIPKVACTNIIRLMLGLNGVENPYNISSSDIFLYQKYDVYLNKMRLQYYRKEKIWERLTNANYTKFLLVRDPYERLYSAYQHKLVVGTVQFLQIYGSQILKKYRPGLKTNEYRRGRGVRFDEFLTFRLNPQDFTNAHGRWNKSDEHWAEVYDLCHPCHVDYDIIGKYETVETDMTHVISSFDPPTDLTWPKRSDHYKNKPTADILHEGYRNISSGLLKNISKLFDRDVNIFGYDDVEFYKRNSVG